MQSRRAAFPVPPDLVSPGGELELWFTSPPGAVMQMPAPMVGSADMARWVVTEAKDRLYARFPGAETFYIVFDLTLMTSRDPALRSIIGDAGKEMRARVGRAVLIPSASLGLIYLKSLEVSVLLLRGFGVNLELAKSLPHTLATLGLTPAPKSIAPDAGPVPSRRGAR